MRAAIATLGSAGDLHPFLAIARALQERGDEVHFLSQEPYRNEVERLGIPFIPIATASEHQRTLDHPDLWHPVRGFGVLWRHLAVPAIDRTWLALSALTESSPRPLRVVASPLVVGARLTAELLPIRLTTAHTAPASLRSLEDPLFLNGHQLPTWTPRPIRKALWQFLDHYKLEPMAAPGLHRWRMTHGLPPLSEPIFDRWLHSPTQVIALFPEDFGPMPHDWPSNVRFAGFPLYDAGSPSGTATDPELDTFCADCESGPLVVLYPGSVATRRTSDIHQAAHLLASQGYRCLLLTTDRENRLSTSSESLLSRTWVSLPHVLPHADFLIHHGGIGTAAQGIYHHVFQVTVPSAYDQFDNAWRINKLQGQEMNLHPLNSLSKRLARLTLHNRCHSNRQDGARLSRPEAPNEAVKTILRWISE